MDILLEMVKYQNFGLKCILLKPIDTHVLNLYIGREGITDPNQCFFIYF